MRYILSLTIFLLTYSAAQAGVWKTGDDVAVDPDGLEADVITLNTDSLSAFKQALAPIFDLPSDLDAIVGKWTAGKAKFPKPE